MPDDNLVAHTFPVGEDGKLLINDGRATDPSGALVTAIDGGSTQIGMQAVQVLNTPDISSDFIKSWQVTAPALTTEILDIFIGDDLVGPTGLCYLAGGEYRCRTAATEGSALHFSIVDRNDVLGLFSGYGLSRTQLQSLTAFSGGLITDIAAGYTAVGGTSGAESKILSVGADFMDVQFHEASFQDGETLSFLDDNGSPTGVSCTLGNWEEGDVIVVQESLKDEWIEGMDHRDIHPGGSKRVPEGMYFRAKLFNNDSSNTLRVKISLTVGRL